ncbi:hypothetical protein M409DRAFT_24320 [Zasmidium cellare ATCC 36951]|uniref:Uncharacterized protein n=1 Tax=Zasmidium cellare ATCC 36951 TaxID=1080233 RepID=A0A6A6CH06_ZASCE|nr:uncharacterized protein M409DRAFT_24320 [Zasmidium cellare ATCC 36951]KAF2165470.1 hypothetical protein M409DRAFT_24320 [Zasmidium cellare ATCC 36951]
MPEDGQDDKTTSLSLLLPDSPTITKSEPSEASPSSESQASTNIDDSQVATELIRISRSFEDAMRNGPPAFLTSLSERHVSPDFTARLDTASIPSWSVYCAVMARWIAANPGYQNTITAATADISDDGRDATVYFLMEAVGWPVELKRMVVSVLKWKKRRRRWLCYENITMRGCDTFDIGGG